MTEQKMCSDSNEDTVMMLAVVSMQGRLFLHGAKAKRNRKRRRKHLQIVLTQQLPCPSEAMDEVMDMLNRGEAAAPPLT